MRTLSFFGGLFIMLLVSSCNSNNNATVEDVKPNIIVILADDAGYADFGFMGQTSKTYC